MPYRRSQLILPGTDQVVRPGLEIILWWWCHAGVNKEDQGAVASSQVHLDKHFLVEWHLIRYLSHLRGGGQNISAMNWCHVHIVPHRSTWKLLLDKFRQSRANRSWYFTVQGKRSNYNYQNRQAKVCTMPLNTQTNLIVEAAGCVERHGGVESACACNGAVTRISDNEHGMRHGVLVHLTGDVQPEVGVACDHSRGGGFTADSVAVHNSAIVELFKVGDIGK